MRFLISLIQHLGGARGLALLGAALLGLAGTTGCSPAASEKPKPSRADTAVPVTLVAVETVPLDRTLPVIGTLFPKDEATLGAEVEGKVEKTMAEFGDRLEPGQEIALIDTTTYSALAQQAAANHARAQAHALNLEQNLRRVQELRKSSIASASELDQIAAESEQARAEEQAAAAAEVIARLNVQRSHVKAPFSAAVADRVASAGDFLRVGAPVFRVVNDAVLKYIVQLPERHAAQIKKEQLVRFSVDAYPGQTFEGRVFLISPSVTTSTRAFAFGALVANADRRLKASTFARGEVILERDVPTPMAPLDAVINFAGVTKVFVVEKGVAHARPVQVGRVRGDKQEILSGLAAGEQVVTSGQTKLFEGALVRVKGPIVQEAQP